MVFEFKLPDIAEGVHEGEVVAWHVKPGQAVKEDQDMVEVMTDKATVMIKSPKTGTVAQLLAKEGEVVKVGQVLITIEVGGAPAKPAAPAPAAAPQAEAKEEKTLFDLPSEFSGASRLRKQGPAKTPAAAGAAAPQAPVGTAPLRQQTLAAPAIRWKAREMGVDLNAVPASGPNGRVTTQDWQQFLAAGPATQAHRVDPS
ncbi:MAG TPA: biotin/lipoyl-containing protein, partial [Candidatus Thermoplasmatota archaeon]|nr:biotin/lipoyl-containing protein [Candidatus Thermoplasmatota archaeon]